jgi:hypothetical protein
MAKIKKIKNKNKNKNTQKTNVNVKVILHKPTRQPKKPKLEFKDEKNEIPQPPDNLMKMAMYANLFSFQI